MNELWDSILDQKKVKENLNTIYVSRRVPHAFLFYGLDGVGKFFTAIQYAKLLYSNQPDEIKDIAVKKISLLQEPYVKMIFSLPRGKGETGEDSAIEKLSKEQIENIQEQIKLKIANPYHKIAIENANTIKINSVRDLKKFTELGYEEIPYRFVIIQNAELMNEQAQNAILKTLEEPPEGFYFFLLTSDKSKLLSTIQSRCWPIDFEPLSKKSISIILNKFYDIDVEKAEHLAAFSDGSLDHAVELSNQNFEFLLEKIISFLRFSIGKKYQSAFNELNEFINSSSKNEILLFVKLIKNWLSDAMKEKYDAEDFYFSSYKETFSKFNQRFKDAETAVVFDKIDLIENYYERNLNLNVLILNIIFELATLSSRNS